MQSRLISTIEWWKKDRKWVCSLICYNGEFSQISLEVGNELSFKLNPGRYCVGYATTLSRTSAPQVALELWKAFKARALTR